MVSEVTLLTSRRSYEFPPDGIRLSVLSLPSVQGRVAQAFSFQVTVIATPMMTFGEVPQTLPPGLVFDLGTVVDDGGKEFALRFIHFEARRIVIDVAGPSRVLDSAFHQLREVLSEDSAWDGRPVIGEPTHTLDYSEFSAQFDGAPELAFRPAVLHAFREVLHTEPEVEQTVITPTIYAVTQSPSGEYPGAISSPNNRTLQFSLRQGSRPENRTCFSGAPVDSDTHLAYLEALERALA